jgi:two-component system cell cycle sensor histidine kinase/response regulator CckA
VVEAVDGEDAVQKYLDASPPFDLVLIDLDMPRLGGAEALARIRASHPHVKAIFLSGGVHFSGLERVNFLQKPFNNDELLGLVQQTLEAEVGPGMEPAAP